MDHGGSTSLAGGQRRTETAEQGGGTIKALQWIGRIIAILAVVMAAVIGLSGNWGDALYALFLAAIVWFWTDYTVARLRQRRKAQESPGAGQGQD